FIIKNMAKLQQYKGIEEMSLHLGDYYRYMTQLDNKNVTLREELEFVSNYLDIHVIRLQRLSYTIDVPEDMLDLYVPRLIVQPLTENALEHGIETDREGQITVIGERRAGFNYLIIEDNGRGLQENERFELEEQINTAMNSQDGQ